MENFNKNSLKSAVAKYGPLNGTMPKEAFRDEIAKDENGYSTEQVDAIYLAINPDEPIETVQLVAVTPELVQTILDSNQAVIDSNQLLIDTLSAFKGCSGNSNAVVNQTSIPVIEDQEINVGAKYRVAEGKSFRDASNFSIEYPSGHEVTHLGAERLKSLLNQGLIEEV